jgi:Na+/proline symporter
MLTFLPTGLLGLVVASLIAAFMSTISTHLNWGSSYIVNDFYRRFVNPDVSEEQMVWVGRLSTVLLMIVAAIVALFLNNAKAAFDIIVLMGAGTGLLFILRWFWWRINAYSEIAAMVISFLVAITFKFIIPGTFAGHIELILGVLITTVGWIAVTYMTPATDKDTLVDFYRLIKPHSYGWKKVVAYGVQNQKITPDDITVGKLPMELSGMFGGIFLVYSALFSLGFWIYGNQTYALIGLAIVVISGYVVRRAWNNIG